MSSIDDTTQLLLALRHGDRGALDRLMPLLYDELQRMAHRELARHGGHDSIRTTSLVHETYLKLVDQSRIAVEDRAHFLALAATAMRHIVIDFARRRGTRKRGGGWKRLSFDDALAAPEPELADVVAVDEALRRLERFDERLSRVVECRFFGGMTVPETATALGLAPRTVDRAWQKAKAWLYREMHET